jgi:hypothetical protein
MSRIEILLLPLFGILGQRTSLVIFGRDTK